MDRGPLFLLFWLPVHHSLRKGFIIKMYMYHQNSHMLGLQISGVTGRGQSVHPKTSDWGISADLPGKERQGEQVKWSRKEGKLKRGSEKLKMEGGNVTKLGEVFFFFLFYFFFLCFSLFKMTEVCFGCIKIGIFYSEKAFTSGKKILKSDFAPSEKYSSYTPATNTQKEGHFEIATAICSDKATHNHCLP